MSTRLDAMCPACSSIALSLKTESAMHDVYLIDLVATCDDCGLVLNTFVSIEDMTVVGEDD